MDEMNRMGAIGRMLSGMPEAPASPMGDQPMDAPAGGGDEIASIASQLEAAMLSLPEDQQALVKQAVDILRSLPNAGPPQSGETDGFEAESLGDFPAL